MVVKCAQACIAVLVITFAFSVPSTSQIFKTPPGLYPSGASTGQWATVADINNDGKPDAIIANYGSESGGGCWCSAGEW